jgi:large-conductance mechanosensitive channel
MSNSNETNNADSNIVNTKRVLFVLVVLGLLVVGFYYFNFNSHILKKEIWQNVFQNISESNDKWGAFGDYVGGILNPVIAAFAFYLIAKTYELQKTELEATRSLLELSTNAQKEQIKLAALTALLNSNLTRISMLESEKISLLQGTIPASREPGNYQEHVQQGVTSLIDSRCSEAEVRKEKIKARLSEIEIEVKNLAIKNNKLEEQIEAFLAQ